MKPFIKFPLYGLLVVFLLLVAVISFFLVTRQAAPEALAALDSDPLVYVDQGGWISFYPLSSEPDTGLVLYPGGFVDARAYAGSARGIAESGFLVVLIRPPLGTAFLAIDEAGPVMAAYPEIDSWAVGGHSLGGTVASRYVYGHPGTVDGLVLWAAYPASADDLSDSSLAVLSLYGEHDGLVPKAEIQSWAYLLPPDTDFVEIPGGNHAQFGRYGDGSQSGDNPASISVDAQEAFVVQAVSGFLGSLNVSSPQSLSNFGACCELHFP